MNNPNFFLCEAVADLAVNFAVAEFHPDDSRELARLCIEWAEEFEKKNAGREWDGEYIEEIDAFFDVKYAAWMDSRASMIPNPIKK